MADPFSVVVLPIVKVLIQHASSEILKSYLLVKGLDADVKTLESHCTTIGAVLQDAEKKQLKNTRLKDWLRKLKDVAYHAEDVLDTLSTEAHLWNQNQQGGCNFMSPLMSCISKASTKHDMALEIKNILARLDTISLEQNQFDLKTLNMQVDGEMADTGRPRSRGSVPTVRPDVEGRKGDKEEIIKRLLYVDPNPDSSDSKFNLSVIPIVGVGGIGKTTLAQLIYNDNRIKKHFGCTMWVCVSTNFNLDWILKDMLKSLDTTTIKPNINSRHLQARAVDEVSTKQRFSSIKDDIDSPNLQTRIGELLAEKRFLLVLDYFWTEEYMEWDQLFPLLKHRGAGSKVLVTCRSEIVAKRIGTTSAYKLDRLPKDDCLSLFYNIAFKEDCNLDEEQREILVEIAQKIVRKCNGLPLAVKIMGGLLRGNTDVKEWTKILKKDIGEIEEAQNSTEGVLAISKISYDYLPPHLKQCFAYCSIFPKTHVFEKQELVKLWLAEGYIQPSTSGLQNMEEIGNQYFACLCEKLFFQISNDDEKTYTMEYFMYELAQSISRPYCCQVLETNTSWSADSRHLSLLCEDVQQPALEIINKKYNKVRTLVLPSEHRKNIGRDDLDKLFHTLRFIRVLDLSSTTIKELPNSVEEMKLLRHLNLSKTDINMLPNSICNLFNLQTLKLLKCRWLSELPKDLGKLINLRHLELDGIFWYNLSTLPPRVGSLTNLHNFHAFPVGSCESGYGINELKGMLYLTGTLHISKLENAVNAVEARMEKKERLQKVVFEWSNRDVDPEENWRCSDLFKWRSWTDHHDAAAAEKVLEDLKPHSNIKELEIRHYEGSTFPTWMTAGELLEQLVSVSLNYCTKCKLLSLGPSLPHLRRLYIKGMHNLEEWPETECPLYCLMISDCAKLRVLPPSFLKLTVLKIKRCDSLTALPLTPSLKFLVLVDNLVLEDWHEKAFALGIKSLAGLLELKIIGCPKMQALPRYFNPQKLEISGCELLSTLPGGKLACLQQMALAARQDGKLVKAIPNSNTLYIRFGYFQHFKSILSSEMAPSP